MVKRYKKQRIKIRFRIIVFITLLLLLTLLAVKLYTSSAWDGKRRFNIALYNTDSLGSSYNAFFSIEPKQQSAVFLIFSPNTYLEVPFGYKSYPASSVYKLGQLDSEKGGGRLYLKATENTFGLATEAFIVVNGRGIKWPNIKDDIFDIKRRYFNLWGGLRLVISILNNKEVIDTNLSLVDKFLLWNSVRHLRPNQIKLIFLEETNTVRKQVLPDGNSVLILDAEIFDNNYKDLFFDTDIRRENYSIEVANATGSEKIAAQFARIIEHLGAHVIAKTTEKEIQKQACTIKAANLKVKKSIIIERLMMIYNCNLKKEILTDGSQADVKIIIGEDFLK